MDERNQDLPFSESVEMYLLRIALLSRQEQPVPIALLADELGISPVSTNQMCRKLEEKELVQYQPYKGVILTSAGDAVARHVLERRRLWELFMIEALDMPAEQAEDFACRFEHVTPDELSERLAIFLSTVARDKNMAAAASRGRQEHLLTELQAGQSAEVVSIDVPQAWRSFLMAEGVLPGAYLKVLAVSSQGTYLLDVADHQLAVVSEIAAIIQVTVLA
ncbi:MAG: metal-dependent transcriptional regulator [Chloroflexi bacterium]|nr:metal-dependent transcriptional regulator [Chloroflexota bacterium]